MFLGSWVGDPLPVSFFFLLMFSVLFFIPYVHIDAQDGFGGPPSVPRSLSFSPLSSALVCADPAEAGVGSRIIRIIILTLSYYVPFQRSSKAER